MMKMVSLYSKSNLLTGTKLAKITTCSSSSLFRRFGYENRCYYHVNRKNQDSDRGLIHKLSNGFGCIWRFAYDFMMSPVPYTRRTRVTPFYCFTGWRAFAKVMDEGLMVKVKTVALPKTHPQTVRVRWILKDITDVLRRSDFKKELPRYFRRFKWEVFVVDSPYDFQLLSFDSPVIACSTPGGNITFNVNSLEHFERDDEIATILGHQIAYIIANHEGECAARLFWGSINRWVPRLIFTYLIPKPRIVDDIKDAQYKLLREMTMEEDYIGMRLIAAAGYDPRVAPSVYEKMDSLWKKEAEDQPREDDLFETRPSGKRRALALTQVMEESVAVYEKVKANHMVLPREEGGLRLIPKD